MALRTAIILFVFVIIFTTLLAGVYLWTKPALEASATEEKMKLVDEVLPRTDYDNDLLKDTISLPATPALGTDDTTLVYRARKNGQPQALVFEAVAPDGYAGRIRLILAIRSDGTLAGVRVTQHKETPGLGDYIEPKKDKNKARPWITQFNGLSYAALTDKEWKVKKDGGRFDSVAGATVTPRAVIKAIHKATKFVAENQTQLYASPTGEGAPTR
ncbi:MAG: electron transport complex subunit RsxG [Betaproteobacteria bacterium]|uniref:Ion-translocating oxidoreductase complex subunit G n=1 Tax=Candidatus Proximibacter danicus TaxID=2954365 RepID=A0A9D7JZ99_9PROT|nr:electron transport complex subunit RsxG [Candidatus Proximibacter danicus]